MLRRLLPAPAVFGSVAAVVALPLILPSVAMATEVVVFVIATLGCNLLLGYVGLLSFGQAISFGVGAYACGLALISSSRRSVGRSISGAHL